MIHQSIEDEDLQGQETDEHAACASPFLPQASLPGNLHDLGRVTGTTSRLMTSADR
jgi:hypothetical protein